MGSSSKTKVVVAAAAAAAAAATAVYVYAKMKGGTTGDDPSSSEQDTSEVLATSSSQQQSTVRSPVVPKEMPEVKTDATRRFVVPVSGIRSDQMKTIDTATDATGNEQLQQVDHVDGSSTEISPAPTKPPRPIHDEIARENLKAGDLETENALGTPKLEGDIVEITTEDLVAPLSAAIEQDVDSNDKHVVESSTPVTPDRSTKNGGKTNVNGKENKESGSLTPVASPVTTSAPTAAATPAKTSAPGAKTPARRKKKGGKKAPNAAVAAAQKSMNDHRASNKKKKK